MVTEAPAILLLQTQHRLYDTSGSPTPLSYYHSCQAGRVLRILPKGWKYLNLSIKLHHDTPKNIKKRRSHGRISTPISKNEPMCLCPGGSATTCPCPCTTTSCGFPCGECALAIDIPKASPTTMFYRCWLVYEVPFFKQGFSIQKGTTIVETVFHLQGASCHPAFFCSSDRNLPDLVIATVHLQRQVLFFGPTCLLLRRIASEASTLG